MITTRETGLVVTLVLMGANAMAAEKAIDGAELARANTQFAVELYQQLRAEQGNLCFSPFSMSTALGMTYAGAREQTAREMAQTLHFPADHERLHPAFDELLTRLKVPGGEQGPELYLANALWPQQEYAFLPAFLALADEHYHAQSTAVDYVNANEQARLTINEWASEQTNGKIKDLLRPGILNKLTRLVLTNAIYFKGDWAAQFDAKQTREAPFKLVDAATTQCQLMNQTGTYGYLERPAFEAVELPYAGDRLSFVVLLPRAHDGIAKLESTLTGAKLTEWIGELRPRKVKLSLPRFNATSALRLDKVLIKMGMPTAFDASGERPDFSGLDGTRDLFITAVVHKAFMEINEQGAEAAAASAVVIGKRSAPTPPAVFCADHPFIYLLRDRQTGTILFLGRLMDPGA